ncbi:hypothetical protein PA598K_00498 [Paenibacillus sp. 598K]|uniref:hypothetical protein n=1 Tax=Paenibacillus sp. 598K TaxID=1117987 RepID=UPI000FFADEE6|nr:hypothetical protein [Paenibacillus sp. 598K]GBF72260.1 hypothetical protein PA598K_00498 [Paenibacillus sp. 598K]
MARKYGKLPPLDSHPEKLDEEKTRRPAANREAPPLEEGSQTLQRSVGNSAIRRLARTVAVSGSGPLLPREPKYARYARWLLAHVEADGRQELLRRFYALTMPQKRAALVNTVGRPALQSEQYTLDLDDFDRQVTAVKHVQLRHGESEKEADESERGAFQTKASLTPAGLLHPYRELLLWLNYKAVKQGQAALMLRFGRLSVPRKQLALHRMMRFRSITVDAFTRQMTLPVLEREWVDWETVRASMAMAERVKAEGGRSEAETGGERTDGGDTAADELLEGLDAGGLPTALLSLLGLADSDAGTVGMDDRKGARASEEPATGQAQERQPSPGASRSEAIKPDAGGVALLAGRTADYWTRLLLGGKGAQPLAAIAERCRSGGLDREAVVDRYLNLATAPPAGRRKQRDKRLQASGFRTAADCFAFLIRGFAAFLIRGAKEGKDKSCRQALKQWDIPDGADETKAQAAILARLG